MTMIRMKMIIRIRMGEDNVNIDVNDSTVDPEKIRRSSSAIIFLLKISWRKKTIEGKDTLYKIRYK